MLSLDLLTGCERLSWSSASTVLVALLEMTNLGFGELWLTRLANARMV